MGLRERSKGARGEREVVKLFNAHGMEARRMWQYKGADGIPDIRAGQFDVEVKRRKQPNIRRALEQAVSQINGSNQTPIAFTKADRGEWLVTLRAEDFLELAKAVQDGE